MLLRRTQRHQSSRPAPSRQSRVPQWQTPRPVAARALSTSTAPNKAQSLDELDKEGEFHLIKLEAAIKRQFGLSFDKPKVLLAAFTDPTYKDSREHNSYLSVLGRAYVRLQYAYRASHPQQLKLWRQDLDAQDYIQTLLDANDISGSRVTADAYQLAMNKYHADRQRPTRFHRIMEQHGLTTLVRKGYIGQKFRDSVSPMTPDMMESKVYTTSFLALVGAILLDKGEAETNKFVSNTLYSTARRHRQDVVKQARAESQAERALAK